MDIPYELADNLDDAWLNFELDLPLIPIVEGKPNPFYVNRPGNPVAKLERMLLRRYRQPPKYFFSGHRGCGKSTELRRLAANPQIQAKFWPVHFSIRNVADVNNIDYRDVLLATGAQMFTRYRAQGGQLPKQLLKELDSWRGKIEEHITTILSGRTSESEIGAGLDAFFANAALKIKLEPATRKEIRQVFERDVTGLIHVIDGIATAIHAREGRPPLVLIDDLDKLDLAAARAIFYARREIIMQPRVPVVYTVSSSLFYSPEFEAIRDRAVFLPNVKLHTQGDPAAEDREGYRTLRSFIIQRMHPGLITGDAVRLAAEMSGGVFRELARVMRSALDRALEAGRARIEDVDVAGAAAEIRGEYRRILTPEQRELLQEIRGHNQLTHPHALAPLLQMLAVLEYANGEPWCDVHPALEKLLDE
ncbi:MAG: hypothetical protein ACE5GO_06150 [Anaerolineales bacterium]